MKGAGKSETVFEICDLQGISWRFGLCGVHGFADASCLGGVRMSGKPKGTIPAMNSVTRRCLPEKCWSGDNCLECTEEVCNLEKWQREQDAKALQEKREKRNAYMREYYAKNKDAINAKKRAYRQENREKVNEWTRNYRKKNSLRVSEWQHRYYLKNVEKNRAKSKRQWEAQKAARAKELADILQKEKARTTKDASPSKDTNIVKEG